MRERESCGLKNGSLSVLIGIVANLHLSMLDRVGIKLDRVADSTGRLTAIG